MLILKGIESLQLTGHGRPVGSFVRFQPVNNHLRTAYDNMNHGLPIATQVCYLLQPLCSPSALIHFDRIETRYTDYPQANMYGLSSENAIPVGCTC
jgi:hypothetical protein